MNLEEMEELSRRVMKSHIKEMCEDLRRYGIDKDKIEKARIEAEKENCDIPLVELAPELYYPDLFKNNT